MIEISLTQALAVYSVIIAVFVVAIWLYTELSVRRPQRHFGKQFLWRCAFCGCTYLDETAENISKCPRCESYNEAKEAAGDPTLAQTNLEPQPAPDVSGGRASKKKRHRQRHRGPRRRR